MRHFLAFLLFFIVMVGFAKADDQPMRLAVDASPLVFVTAKGKVSIEIEVADTDDKRMRGLMFRKDLPENRGMLFAFKETRPVLMWMKNTPLPLDMVFLGGNGHISTIQRNTEPYSEAIISSGEPAAFVIELRAGTAKKLGLAVGDRVIHPAVCETCVP